MQLKIAEIFYSLQGEGRWAGVPSVFMRTFGCNFQCRGFGLPRGEKTTEPEEIAADIQLYKTYNDLPLARTGCDSYASWHPDFKHLKKHFNFLNGSKGKKYIYNMLRLFVKYSKANWFDLRDEKNYDLIKQYLKNKIANI